MGKHLRMIAGTFTVTAVLLLLGVVTVSAYRAGQRSAQLAQYRERADTVRVLVRQLDTLYKRDTLVFWRTKRLVDTLVIVDSIPTIARDSARADSALRATSTAVSLCASALSTCERRVAAERRLRQLAESTAVAVRAEPPRPRARALDVMGGVLAGVLAGILLAR